jgi:5-methylcytosine-specific restriction endonuclease McrA
MKVTNKKGSKYIGVYKCLKTKKYYFKNYMNKKYHKSKLYHKEIDAAKNYDLFVLKNNSKRKILNFSCNNKTKKTKKTKTKSILKKKKDITKRPKIYEYIKIIIYSRQNDKCSICHDNLGIARVVDHIIPRSLGGYDNIHNYQAICGICNKWKSYKFDYCIKNFIEKNKNLKLQDILKLQKIEFNRFNGNYPYEKKTNVKKTFIY